VRADSWSIHDLPEKLVNDWYDLFIFTEYDLQVATYYWLRREFDRSRSSFWSVRTRLALEVRDGRKVKSDVVLFKNSVPYDIFELKSHLDTIRHAQWEADLDKLHELKDTWNIRHAYRLILYDNDVNWNLSAGTEPWMN
jgi:hypothetical protein